MPDGNLRVELRDTSFTRTLAASDIHLRSRQPIVVLDDVRFDSWPATLHFEIAGTGKVLTESLQLFGVCQIAWLNRRNIADQVGSRVRVVACDVNADVPNPIDLVLVNSIDKIQYTRFF